MAANPKTTFLDLPLDIILLICPYLDVGSFLSLCATCKALGCHAVRYDSAYWSQAIQLTFRVPNQPVVQKDGRRLSHLYQRLKTQSQAYTWGSNSRGCLGHPPRSSSNLMRVDRRWGRVPNLERSSAGVPNIMDGARDLGIIADLQCGGWSTTILTSKGTLHTVGVLNGLRSYSRHSLLAEKKFQIHTFPPGYPDSSVRLDPYTTIKQFSAGRYHVLGLSDSGRIWYWYSAQKTGRQIRFLQTDIIEEATPGSRSESKGRVRQVVAGWNRSSAYIMGVGIIFWRATQESQDDDTDTLLVLDSTVVPRTGYTRSRNVPQKHRAIAEDVGMVKNYVVLDNFIVFITDIGKIFACGLDDTVNPDIIELTSLCCNAKENNDIQGSFRTFSVLRNGGEVIIARHEYLETCWSRRQDPNFDQTSLSPLIKIPALQNANVIQLAFGDYHFHALHSDGQITSYGREAQGCGAFGLGMSATTSELRGVRRDRTGNNHVLVPHAYTHGRRVWFDRIRRLWLLWLASGGKSRSLNPPVMIDGTRFPRSFLWEHQLALQGELSEWVEQASMDWGKFEAAGQHEADTDDTGSHFALRVTAAGWHSGAVVLVNEDLDNRIRENMIIPISDHENESKAAICEEPNRALDDIDLTFSREELASPGPGLKYKWADDDFPFLRLADGTATLPDFEGPETEWKVGKPEWKLDEVDDSFL